MPADTPVTTPAELTVAFEVLLLLQLPPDMLLVSVIVEPTHTLELPTIDATVGAALTVMVLVTLVEQPPEVTV